MMNANKNLRAFTHSEPKNAAFRFTADRNLNMEVSTKRAGTIDKKVGID